MRGPSSSHCAASVRIGRIARALMDGELKEIEIEYDTNGSLAFTHVSQGSDMGIFGGFLGWDATDDRLVDSAKEIRKAGISVDIKIRDFGAEHPNTYKLSLKNPNEQHTMTALSTGGGMIEVIEIDGARVSIAGDYHETFLFIGSDAEAILEHITENVRADEINLLKGDAIRYIEIKSQKPLDDKTLSDLQSGFDIKYTRTISPVLPMLSRKQIKVPFTNTAELLKYNEGKRLEFWELATHYEAARGNIADDEVFEKMRNIVEIMETSIEAGIQGTHHEDRILGYQSGAFLESMERGKLFDGGILNRMILFTTAMMEMKSAMGVIVAAPTAGSCGVLPGAVIGAAKEMGLSIRIFFLGDDDTLERFPFARYERLLNGDPKEHLTEYAGKRVRCILAVVDLANRTPVSILRTECSYLNFDSGGKIDTAYIEKGSKMLFDGMEPFPDEESPPEVVDARHRFARKRYENEYLWEPTQEIITKLMEAIFGKI